VAEGARGGSHPEHLPAPDHHVRRTYHDHSHHLDSLARPINTASLATITEPVIGKESPHLPAGLLTVRTHVAAAGLCAWVLAG
jgi:hypothetical protein